MTRRAPVLVAFSGRPGVGKSTVARALALASGATYLGIDRVEQAIRQADARDPGVAGYAVLQALAAENLALGRDVLTDCVNPVAASREAFGAAARGAGARLIDVEVVCSHLGEHRRRVENREANVPGLALPDWAAVQARAYEPWTEPRLIIDTAQRSVGTIVAILLRQMDDES